MAFQKSDHSTAYDKFVNALKADAVLRREIKSWVVGTGGKEQDNLLPTTLTRPYLRLYPTTEPAERVDSCSLLAPLVVNLEISLNGTDYRALLDAWGHIAGVVMAMDVGSWNVGVTQAVPTLNRSWIGEDSSINGEAEVRLDQYIDV